MKIYIYITDNGGSLVSLAHIFTSESRVFLTCAINMFLSKGQIIILAVKFEY